MSVPRHIMLPQAIGWEINLLLSGVSMAALIYVAKGHGGAKASRFLPKMTYLATSTIGTFLRAYNVFTSAAAARIASELFILLAYPLLVGLGSTAALEACSFEDNVDETAPSTSTDASDKRYRPRKACTTLSATAAIAGTLTVYQEEYASWASSLICHALLRQVYVYAVSVVLLAALVSVYFSRLSASKKLLTWFMLDLAFVPALYIHLKPALGTVPFFQTEGAMVLFWSLPQILSTLLHLTVHSVHEAKSPTAAQSLDCEKSTSY